ncbi:biotin/lipoyl-containing protein [uncultured Parolsenella sp.]|uniref:biotin/lipoyl-containing protein n=1 Tax=uncultured Parolsenella sp. TaxID=2083008 RepID=UPI0025F7B2A3|nr:biotin/lipoyl-containing protein [uncultured Parolsenella sp.]
MLRKFKINVDGTEYKVEMEEIGAPVPTPADAVAPVAAPAPVAAAAPAPAAEAAPAPAAESAATPAGDGAQLAPMPGKILDIKMAAGQAVKEGDVVLILEAMKMENEIVAESSGTIQGIHVNKGDMVNPGDPLFTIA